MSGPERRGGRAGIHALPRGGRRATGERLGPDAADGEAAAFDRPSLARLQAASGRKVSRETLERLLALAELVRAWQARINLVAPSTLPELWRRHVLDSAQLPALAPDAGGAEAGAAGSLTEEGGWIDLGSGGGFPGLVVAALSLDPAFPRRRVTLVESAGKKAAFLRRAALELGLDAEVRSERIESLRPAPGVSVVSARALAPLPSLLTLARPWLAAGAVGLFPKGRDAESELAALGGEGTAWRIERRPNRVAPEGEILRVAARDASPA